MVIPESSSEGKRFAFYSNSFRTSLIFSSQNQPATFFLLSPPHCPFFLFFFPLQQKDPPLKKNSSSPCSSPQQHALPNYQPAAERPMPREGPSLYSPKNAMKKNQEKPPSILLRAPTLTGVYSSVVSPKENFNMHINV